MRRLLLSRCACGPPSCGRRSTARACASSRSGNVRTHLSVIVYLRLAFGDRASCCSRAGRVARAFGRRRPRRARLDAGGASSSPGPRCSCSTARSTSRSPCSCSSSSAALVAGATREPGSRRGPGSRALAGSSAWSSAGSCWHVEGAVTGDGLFHEARVRKLVDLTSLHLRSVDEFSDGGLHPGLRVPALARVPRARLVVLGRRSRCGRPARAVAPRADRLRRRVGGGRRGLRVAGGGRVVPDALARRLLLRARARRLVGDAVAARRRRRASCSCRRRSRSSSRIDAAGCAAARRSSERSRSCIRPMRCSCSCRSRCTPCCASTSGDGRRRCSPLRSCRPGSRCSG